MGDIAELESRITAALDRIAAGIEDVGEAGTRAALAEAAAAHEAELAEERQASAALEEQVAALRQEQTETVANLQGEVTELRDEVAGLKNCAQRH